MSEQTSLEKLSPRSAEVPATITVPAYTVAQEEAEAVPLLDYWRIVRKRQWTVVSILLLIFVTVTIGTLKQRPVYRAKAVLQIDRENPNILFKQVIEFDPGDEYYLETAYKNLQSRTLIRRVIDKLQLHRVAEFNEQSQRRSSAPSVAQRASAEAESDVRYNLLIEAFLRRLTISPIRRSRLVEISFDSYDPVLASRVVNTLAHNYIDQNLEVKWLATQKASEWLSQQLVTLKASLEKSEEEVQRYAKENSILLLDEKQTMAGEKLKQLQEELTRAEADLFQKDALHRQVRSGDVTSVPGMLDNRAYQDLSVRLAELKRQYAEETITFTPEYPKVKKLKSQIDEIEQAMHRERTTLARKISDDYQAAVSRVRLLRDAVNSQTREFNQIAEKSIQYGILKREADTNRQLYDGLLQRMKEAGVSAGLKASNIRVVDEAEPPRRPAKPRKTVNLSLALLLGLALGIGAAFFQEYLDSSLKTPDDVQRYVRLPVLGVIPSSVTSGKGKHIYGYGYGSRKRLPAPQGADSAKLPGLIGSDSNNQLSEAYRSLRTSVLLSTSGRPPRLILVTSAAPGEGKTTTVINLGITLAQLGSRVLVVDSDMRRPRVATLLRLKGTPLGLSTYLTGQATLQESVIATDIPNLHAVLCGPTPPNPAELLSSSLMSQFLSQARDSFDYVLMDSPPVLHVADARILATMAEAVILVTHGGVTPRAMVNHAKMTLLQVNANVIGVALNNVDFSSVGYDYYYRYYYSRRYGYGYGYGYGYQSRPADEHEDRTTTPS